MQYKFYLDGSEVENPAGWDKMKRRISRDKDLKAVLLNLDANLTFQGNGYYYLKSLFDQSYCGKVKIEILQSRDDGQTYYQRYSGTLFVTEMEFDEFKCYAKVRVTDESYYAYIFANKNIETNLLGGRSKNSPDVYNIGFDQFGNQYPRIQKFQLFDPTNCTYFSNIEDYGCFVVDEALNYLVKFMSDDNMDYYSPLFGAGGKYQFLVMTYGLSIRKNGLVHDGGSSMTEDEFTKNLPSISFQKLFSELNRFFNLGITIIRSPSGKPRLYIDEWKNFFRQTNTTTFSNLPNLKVSVASEDIFAQVAFGGDSLTQDDLSFPQGEATPLTGFKEDKLFTVTQCNVDSTLDLTGDFIVDTNIIEEISLASIDLAALPPKTGNDSYDKDWFFLDTNYILGTNHFKAIGTNWIDSTLHCYYNELLNNLQTSLRHFGFIPAPLAKYVSPSPVGKFRAEKTSNQSMIGGAISTWDQVFFQNDSTNGNYDATGTYDNATSRFTIPADGVYTFAVELKWFINNLSHHQVSLARYDTTFTTLLSRTIIGDITGTSAGTRIDQFIGTLNADATDIIVVETILLNPPPSFFTYPIYAPSFFKCTQNEGGGIFTEDDPAKYPVVKNTFKTEISKSQTDAIEANALGLINFYVDPLIPKTGFIQEIIIDEFNGTVDAVLIQGTGYPPQAPACVDEFGAFVIPNSDFASGDSIWNKLQDAANWNITTLGAQHIPPGSVSPFDAIENTAMLTAFSPTNKWRVKISVSGMTAGSFFVDASGYSSATWSADGTYTDIVDLLGDPLVYFSVVVSDDFDGLITFADIQPQIVECDTCVVGFGANVLPNPNFSLGDNGDWSKTPSGNWLIDTSGAQHFDNGGAMTADKISTTTISNQNSPTFKWKVTVRVTGRTAGSYQVNAAGYLGAVQYANGTYSEILDLAGDPLSIFFVIVSDDFDGKIHVVKAEPQLNEC